MKTRLAPPPLRKIATIRVGFDGDSYAYAKDENGHIFLRVACEDALTAFEQMMSPARHDAFTKRYPTGWIIVWENL